ncbi:MAG: tryptophan--tRNA ligase [Phototrophicaceae bacterium]
MTAPVKPDEQSKTKKKTSLTGIKPTGTPHLGNYLGAIKPALELVEDYKAFYFIADYHGLTTIRDKKEMKQHTYEVAATWLALGLDPEEVVFYRQSDVPEVFELTWVLSCFTGKGWLNRAHAYKASVDSNAEAGHDPDDGINVGLYNYPVLMAADIILFNTDVVPVGQDQRQHLEIARDIANAFNYVYGNTLVPPEALILENVATVPGLDGRKMSKSYGNTIELFAPSKKLRKQVMRIVTDSKTPEEPKNPDDNNIFNIYKHFATPDMIAENRKKYTEGGVGYGDLKQELFEVLDAHFSDPRERYNELMADRKEIDAILGRGAEFARRIASRTVSKVRRKIGIG